MKKQLADYLKKLNVAENEANIYFTLLKTGPLNASNLAHTIGIKRTTVYNYIRYLMDKGLVIKSVSSAETIFEATPPDQILPDLITQKIQEGQDMQIDLPQLLNLLQDNLFSDKPDTPNNVSIKFYKGFTSARKIYEESFKAKEVRAFAKIDKELTLWKDNTKVFNEAFENNKQLTWWEIIYGEAAIEVSENIYDHTNRYFFKFLPKRLKLSSEDILIYDEKVAILNFRGGGTSIVLQNADFYNNLKELFDFIWILLSDPEAVRKDILINKEK